MKLTEAAILVSRGMKVLQAAPAAAAAGGRFFGLCKFQRRGPPLLGFFVRRRRKPMGKWREMFEADLPPIAKRRYRG